MNETVALAEDIKQKSGYDETKYIIAYIHHAEEKGDVVYTMQRCGYRGSSIGLVEGLTDSTILFGQPERAEKNADTYRKVSKKLLEMDLMIPTSLADQIGENAIEIVGRALQVLPVERKLKFA